PDYRAWVRLKRGDALLEWRPVAKDGFDVPAHQSTSRPAELEMGPGETADFSFTPEDPGSLVIEIGASMGEWSLVQPIEVR
ncbi:MAG TPA: hypothetical protein VM778_05780, partial [Gemmatimonadota bacterium]|nr:hypothetical protein [Gemmatimonadota bacterium]